MNINKYYENLIFDSGVKINVSGQVDDHFLDVVHWHPYVEVIVSRCDGNEVTVNFAKYILNRQDTVIAWSGDLHSMKQTARQP